MKKQNKRWLAALLAGVMVLSAAAVGLGLTYAESPVQQRFVQTNGYMAVEVGQEDSALMEALTGINDVSSSDVEILLADKQRLQGVAAGVGSISVSTRLFTIAVPVQVTDSSFISGYDLADGGTLKRRSSAGAFNINDYVITYTTLPGDLVDGTVEDENYVPTPEATAQITWDTRDDSIATCSPAGEVTPQAAGLTALIGEFTDRWGVPRSISFVLGIDVSVGGEEPPLLAPEIITESLIEATLGQPYVCALTVTGGEPITWVVDGALPDGLIFADGEITGTPQEPGEFMIAVTAENAAGSDTKLFVLTVSDIIYYPEAPVITTTALPPGSMHMAYEVTLEATGDTPITWALEGELPSGLSFADGTISGTPSADGEFTFTVTAENETGSDSATYTLAIAFMCIIPPAEEGADEAATDGRILTALAAGDSSDWLEIATNGGYSLLLRVDPLENGSAAAAQAAMDTWFAALEADSPLRSKAVVSDAADKCGTIDTYGDRDALEGRSLPGETAPAEGEHAAFLLSYQEAARFCSVQWRSRNHSFTDQASAQAAAANWNSLGSAAEEIWWLRSPARQAGNLSVVDAEGKVLGGGSPATAYALRPAIWVCSDILD